MDAPEVAYRGEGDCGRSGLGQVQGVFLAPSRSRGQLSIQVDGPRPETEPQDYTMVLKALTR